MKRPKNQLVFGKKPKKDRFARPAGVRCRAVGPVSFAAALRPGRKNRARGEQNARLFWIWNCFFGKAWYLL
jgi:hypothetical protein